MVAFFALLLSTTSVVLLNRGWGKRKSEKWASACVAGSAWVSGCSIILAMATARSPHGLLATVGFVLLLIVGKFANLSSRPMAIISWAIFSVFWIWSLTSFVLLQSEYEEWKKQVPIESMTDRVPEPKHSESESTLDFASNHKREFDGMNFSGSNFIVRNQSIRNLHTQTVAAFDRAAGFGPIRMRVIHPEADYFLPDNTPPIPQPAEYDPDIVSLGDELHGEFRPNLKLIYYEGLADFANPSGWGYIKSRSEVAGFQSHRFSKLPKPQEGWRADRIDLISLVMHDEPVAYVSESLPRMENIDKLKTRELDEFETVGLAHVRKTDELFIRGNEQTVRVIGPLRSVNECQKCHGGKVGDLLGAFSYTMTKTK